MKPGLKAISDCASLLGDIYSNLVYITPDTDGDLKDLERSIELLKEVKALTEMDVNQMQSYKEKITAIKERFANEIN